MARTYLNHFANESQHIIAPLKGRSGEKSAAERESNAAAARSRASGCFRTSADARLGRYAGLCANHNVISPLASCLSVLVIETPKTVVDRVPALDTIRFRKVASSRRSEKLELSGIRSTDT